MFSTIPPPAIYVCAIQFFIVNKNIGCVSSYLHYCWAHPGCATPLTWYVSNRILLPSTQSHFIWISLTRPDCSHYTDCTQRNEGNIACEPLKRYIEHRLLRAFTLSRLRNEACSSADGFDNGSKQALAHAGHQPGGSMRSRCILSPESLKRLVSQARHGPCIHKHKYIYLCGQCWGTGRCQSSCSWTENTNLNKGIFYG